MKTFSEFDHEYYNCDFGSFLFCFKLVEDKLILKHTKNHKNPSDQ